MITSPEIRRVVASLDNHDCKKIQPCEVKLYDKFYINNFFFNHRNVINLSSIGMFISINVWYIHNIFLKCFFCPVGYINTVSKRAFLRIERQNVETVVRHYYNAKLVHVWTLNKNVCCVPRAAKSPTIVMVVSVIVNAVVEPGIFAFPLVVCLMLQLLIFLEAMKKACSYPLG